MYKDNSNNNNRSDTVSEHSDDEIRYAREIKRRNDELLLYQTADDLVFKIKEYNRINYYNLCENIDTKMIYNFLRKELA